MPGKFRIFSAAEGGKVYGTIRTKTNKCTYIMEELKKKTHRTLTAIITAINHYKKYGVRDLRQLLVLSHFCTVEVSTITDAYKNLNACMDYDYFNGCIEMLIEQNLLRQVNKRGIHKIYAPTDIAIKLYKAIIFL